MVERLKITARCDWRDEVGHYSYADAEPAPDGEYVRYSDYEAAIRAGGEPVAVKPLVWEKIGGFTAVATSAVGVNYGIQEFGAWAGNPFQLTIYDAERANVSFHKTETACKDAAQADYEQRIRSALVSATSDLERQLAEVRAELERVTLERDAAELAARNGRSLSEDTIQAIRERLNDAGVPLAAFIDDHVGNAIAERDALAVDKQRLATACEEANRAVAFFDKRQASSDADQIAVGSDHWDWLESAVRKCAAAHKAGASSDTKERGDER